jgi:hypothetical protein
VKIGVRMVPSFKRVESVGMFCNGLLSYGATQDSAERLYPTCSWDVGSHGFREFDGALGVWPLRSDGDGGVPSWMQMGTDLRYHLD